jgi:hypothetical protein
MNYFTFEFMVLVRYVNVNMWRVWGRGEAYTGFWWGNMKKRERVGDPGTDGRIILRRIIIFFLIFMDPCIVL